MTDFVGWDELLKIAPPEGLVLEFGVFRGTTMNQICDAARPRLVYGFDSFYGLPEDWTLPHYPKGTFSRGGLEPKVRENGRIVKGLIDDTLDPFLRSHGDDVSFVHFDMDLYRPTALALSLLADRFRVGSICLFDEWLITGEERRAFTEFLEATGFGARYVGKRTEYAWAFQLIGGTRCRSPSPVRLKKTS